jgi:hypothetical protein
LHGGHSLAAVAGPFEPDIRQQRVARLEADLPLSDRSSPRTATMEEVTSRAQIATCTTSSRSRMAIRRPAMPVGPALMTW